MMVPEGAGYGDSLTFNVNGNDLEIAIPEGSKAGDVLQIQVQVESDEEDIDGSKDATQDDDDDGDDDVTKVLLKNLGITLELHNKIPSSVEASSFKDKGETSEEGQIKCDGTFAMPWQAGIHLAQHICSDKFHESFAEVRNVLELGSGTGLCGIAFAVNVTNKLSKRKAHIKKLNLILTDMPNAMNTLQYNLDMNKNKLSSQLDEKQVHIAPLVWGENANIDNIHSKLEKVGGADLILGSDLLYNVSLDVLKGLCKTIKSIDSRKKARILLSVRWRKPEEERVFFELMRDNGYHFELLEHDCSPYACQLNWEEFGNPKSKKSNEFFGNNYAKVDGESKPLKDVCEDDMDIMSDDEFDQFERRFIQVYVGKSNDKI